MSKKIKKNKVVEFLRKQSSDYPEEWRELHILRELVKAKYWELQAAELKFEKAIQKFKPLMQPSSPVRSVTSSEED